MSSAGGLASRHRSASTIGPEPGISPAADWERLPTLAASIRTASFGSHRNLHGGTRCRRGRTANAGDLESRAPHLAQAGHNEEFPSDSIAPLRLQVRIDIKRYDLQQTVFDLVERAQVGRRRLVFESVELRTNRRKPHCSDEPEEQ